MILRPIQLCAFLVFGCLTGLPSGVLAEEEQCSLSASELLNEPKAEYGQLAYTEMISDDTDNWVGRYDPNHPDQPGWRLQYVSGAEPSEAQRQQYARWKADQPHGFDLKQVLDRIDLNSIRMTGRTRRSQWFGFEPKVQEGQSSAYIAPLSGYVSRPIDGRCHLIVEISNEEPYAPAPGLWVAEYRYVVVLGRRGPQQLLYPLLVQSVMLASIMPGTLIDSTMRFRYSYAY